MQPWKKTGIWQKWLQPTQFGDTVLVISLKVVNLNLNLNLKEKVVKKEPKWEEMIDRRRLTNKKKHAAVNTLASWCCLSANPLRIHLGIMLEFYENTLKDSSEDSFENSSGDSSEDSFEESFQESSVNTPPC